MTTSASARIARLILQEKGELTKYELAALPWLEDKNEIDHVFLLLQQSNEIELRQRRVSSLIPEWEDVLVLISNKLVKAK